MELWLPEQIVLNEASHALLKDVDDTARIVNEYRTLPPAVIRRIEEDLLGERVYSSNAIEGNTLDLRETVMILKQGIVGVKKKREALEARNLGDAARHITECTDQGKSCHTLDMLREVHRLALREIDDDWAGRLRDHRVMIQGAVHQPPDHALLPSFVERVLQHLGRPGNEPPALQAAWAHWALVRIHPFHDRNGRIARLWQDLVLAQGRLTCAVIRPEDRRQYLDALGQADEGHFDSFVQLIAQRILASFDKYIAELRRAPELDEWVAAIEMYHRFKSPRIFSRK